MIRKGSGEHREFLRIENSEKEEEKLQPFLNFETLLLIFDGSDQVCTLYRIQWEK